MSESAVETLQISLKKAEAGDFNHVIVITGNFDDEAEHATYRIVWSAMNPARVWWMFSWIAQGLKAQLFARDK